MVELIYPILGKTEKTFYIYVYDQIYVYFFPFILLLLVERISLDIYTKNCPATYQSTLMFIKTKFLIQIPTVFLIIHYWFIYEPFDLSSSLLNRYDLWELTIFSSIIEFRLIPDMEQRGERENLFSEYLMVSDVMMLVPVHFYINIRLQDW